MQWFKHHNGTLEDTKLSMVAQRSGVKRGLVYALWCALLEYASSAKTRGTIEGVDLEELAFALDMEEDEIAKALAAMRSLKRPLLDGETVTSWEKRNSKSDKTSNERVKRFRERQRNETDGNAVTSVTGESVTDETALDKNRQDKDKITPSSPPRGKGKGARLPSDWILGDEDLGYAVDKGLSKTTALNVAEQFRNYWHGKAGQGGVKLDWSKTWQNWILKHINDNGTGDWPKAGKSSGPEYRGPRIDPETQRRVEATRRANEKPLGSLDVPVTMDRRDEAPEAIKGLVKPKRITA